MRPRDLLGLHAPNCKMPDVDGGVQHYIDQLRMMRATWAKIMWPDHTRADAQALRAAGFRLLARAPGEGRCYASDLRAMGQEYGGLVEVIEGGNEPLPALMWEHCWYLEDAARQCKADLNRAGIKLISPGWTGNADPPARPPDDRPWQQWPEGDPNRLAARILQVYRGLDGVGFHAYGVHVLENLQVERIARWASAFPGLPLYGTEIGISSRDLSSPLPVPTNYAQSQLIKAVRYVDFANSVAMQLGEVEALIIFIADAGERGPAWVRGWGSFLAGREGQYVEKAPLGYFLGQPGLERLGQIIA